ncbi:unnamed protein product [Mytilus coruscus]|uniref:Uncharacterized protein n=1 Tax=Mytilus coruscus TaxID=42192 RepID=A0A6J8A6S7_MYTCO|nr:unnamed protein product [Mytilus coruscus]
MDYLERVRRAYLLAMALQHVDQINLNMHQYLQGIRRRRRRQRRRLWQQPWVSRRKQFGLYGQLLVELRQEDQSSFRNFMRMTVEMYDEILQRIQHLVSKQYTWFRFNCSVLYIQREPLEPGLNQAATLRHLAAGSTYADMKFSWRVPGPTTRLRTPHQQEFNSRSLEAGTESSGFLECYSS